MISNNKNLKYLVLLFFLIEVLIVYTLTNYPLNKVNNSAFFISNFGLVIFCIIYFNELFKNMPVIDLKATPSFWIITGILFCMSAHFPIAATLDFLNGKVSFFVIKNLSNVKTLFTGQHTDLLKDIKADYIITIDKKYKKK